MTFLTNRIECAGGLTETALLIGGQGKLKGSHLANMILHYTTAVHRMINTAFYTYEACSKHFRDFITEHFIFHLGVNRTWYTESTPTTNTLLLMFPLPIHRSNFFFYNFLSSPRMLVSVNLLAPELFFLILAHPVYKMWIIQEPNKLALWNKLHFEEKKRRV